MPPLDLLLKCFICTYKDFGLMYSMMLKKHLPTKAAVCECI